MNKPIYVSYDELADILAGYVVVLRNGGPFPRCPECGAASTGADYLSGLSQVAVKPCLHVFKVRDRPISDEFRRVTKIPAGPDRSA